MQDNRKQKQTKTKTQILCFDIDGYRSRTFDNKTLTRPPHD